MKRYSVRVYETHMFVTEVEANSPEEAEEIASSGNCDDIQLEYVDCQSAEATEIDSEDDSEY